MKHETQTLLTAGKLIKSIAREPFAWPGGYLRVLVNEGACVCGPCVKEHFQEELYAATNWSRDLGEFLVYSGDDAEGYCEHCNRSLNLI